MLTASERPPFEHNEFFTTSTGASIYVRDFRPILESGSVPLLCLHGFLRNSRDFCELGKAFATQGVRVIAPDLRGRGFSTWFDDASQYHYDLVKQDVRELLAHLQIERVAILGVALGALIAMDLVAEQPGLVAGYILNDQGTEVDKTSSGKMASNAQGGPCSYQDAVERMKLHFGESYPDLSHDQWEALTLRAYREHSPGQYARDLDMGSMADVPRLVAERPDAWPAFLATQGTPVAILRGAHSTYFSADCALRMVERHDLATLTTVPGRGHPPLLDEPEATNAIKALLEVASQ